MAWEQDVVFDQTITPEIWNAKNLSIRSWGGDVNANGHTLSNVVIEDAGGQVANVRAFGAVGDGVTLDTVAFQDAVDSLTNGGTVYVPPGTYRLDQVTLANRISIQGAGAASILIPDAADTTIFSKINADADVDGNNGDLAHIYISNLYFDGTEFLFNTVEAIHVMGQMYGIIDDCVFNEIRYAFYGDRINCFKITDCHLIDNSTLWIGSTLSWDGTGTYFHYYATNTAITNLSHKISNESTPTRLTDGLKIIVLQRAVAANIDNFTCQALVRRGIGVSMENDCQGNIVGSGTVIVQAHIGVQLLETTVDGVLSRPGFNKITNSIIDQYGDYAIWFDENVALNQIHNNEITGHHETGLDEIAGVFIAASAWGNQIQNNYFQNQQTGNAIHVNTPLWDLMIQGNYFNTNISGGSDILISGSGLADHVTISDNMRAAFNTTTFYIFNTGVGAFHHVVNNSGIDEVLGADLASATSLTLDLPAHYVTGSNVITTINDSDVGVRGAYTGEILLLRAPGATWSLGTGGNIGAAVPSSRIFVRLRFIESNGFWIPDGI